MATDDEIITAVALAIQQAKEEGANWAECVDQALDAISVEVDTDASREADKNGYGPVAILSDGRKIWQAEDTGRITIQDA